MQKHKNGNVVLSEQEIVELTEAYEKLYGVLSGFPTRLCDFCDDMDEYANIKKWHCLLTGREFNRTDWIDEDEE